MRGVTLNRLRVLLKVVATGQVSLAAREMGISQPSVSQQLSSLQDYFGFDLLTLERGRLRPGPRTTELLAIAERIDKATQRIYEMASSSTENVLYIGATPSAGMYFVPGLLRSTKAACPELRIMLSILPRDELRKSLHRGLIDIAFGTDLIPEAGMASSLLHTESVVAISAHDAITLDLPNVDIFVSSDLMPYVNSALDRITLQSDNTQIIILDDVESLKKTVEAGLGVGVVFRSSVERELRHQYLHVVPSPDLETTVPFSAVFPDKTSKQDRIADLLRRAKIEIDLKFRAEMHNKSKTRVSSPM